MNSVGLIWTFAAGVAIGLFFVVGLWYTVGRWTDHTLAGPIFLASFLMRTLISVGGFYMLIGHGIEYALAALAGFLVARVVTVRVLGSTFNGQPGESIRVS